MQLLGATGLGWLLATVAWGAIGVGAKENAALLPTYLLALELTVLRFETANPHTSTRLKQAYGLACVLALAAFFIFVLPEYLAPHAFNGRGFTLAERLLTQLRVLPMYIGQMFLPTPGNLAFFYDDLPKSTGWLSPPTTLLGAAFLSSLVWLAWLNARQRPLIALGILWFFAGHLLTSNVFNLELAFEHRNYFALLGIVVATTESIRLIPMQDGPRLKYFAVGAVVAGFVALAMLRSATWGNPVSLGLHLVQTNPSSPRASM